MATEKLVDRIGIVTAYGYAKSKGYTGTEEQFASLMGSYADVATGATEIALKAEGYALGTQDGQDVTDPLSPYYNKNAAYYNREAQTAYSNVNQAKVDAQAAAQNAAQAKADAEAAKNQVMTAYNNIENINAAAENAQTVLTILNGADADTFNAVSYTKAQDLDATSKAQAQANIGLSPNVIRYDADQTQGTGHITSEQQAVAQANIGLSPNVVRFDVDQTQIIGNAAQEIARTNIGASPAGAVLVTAQTLTEEEKAQARENIGATTGAIRYDVDQTGQDGITAAEQAVALHNIGGDTAIRYDINQTGQGGITSAQQATAQANIGLSPNVIRYDIDQTSTLTAEQQARARENIGASSGAVRYDVAQSTLTENEKATARSNIGVTNNNVRWDINQNTLSDNDKARARSNIGISNYVEDATAVEGGIRFDFANGTNRTVQIDPGGLEFDGGHVDEDNLLHLTMDGQDIEGFTPFAIPAGGGGGGQGGAGDASITRVTNASVDCIYGDPVPIRFTFTATDSGGDAVGNGVGTWSIGGIQVANNITIYQGLNTFDIAPYLTDGMNAIKLSVSVDTGGSNLRVVTKTWTVNAVNMYFTWAYDDAQINTASFTDRWTPYGDIEKTTHLLLDSIEMETSTTTRSGVQQGITIPMQSHGVHTLERWVSAEIGGEPHSTPHQYHEAIFVVEGNSTPIISISKKSGTMNQYDTVRIPVVVYNPVSLLANAALYVDGTQVGTWANIDRSVQYWNYTPTTAGQHTLTVTCGVTSRSITMTVTEVDIDVEEISGYSFKFKASELVTNSAAQTWNSNGVTASFSENFDWINGGLHTEEDENGSLQQYFCIKAGTRMIINHKLFSTDPKANGMNFKMIYKVKNCRNYDAQIGNCYSDVGIRLFAHEARFNSSGTSISVPYGEDEYIELEFDVYPAPRQENDGNFRYIMAWMDGVITSCRVYGANDNFVHALGSQQDITLGSDDCDIYIYLVKAYPALITRDEHIDNFIIDAPNASEMIRRYNRNDILDESGQINYEKLMRQNPNCRVWLYDIPYMTNGKKDKVNNCSFHQFWPNGDRYYEISGTGTMTVQGTSSVKYIQGAANTDINFKTLTDGYNNDLMANGTEDETYGNNWYVEDDQNPGHAKVYTVADAREEENLGDGESLGSEWIVVQRDANRNPTHYIKALGYKINDNSCPITYSNMKVNFASCEQVNNMCNAQWYQRFNPYPSLTPRDCMEFAMGVQFIKDAGDIPDDSHFVLFGDNKYHMYSIGNLGNSKKNVHVFHDLSNPNEVCIEVNDNDKAQMRMVNDDLSAEDWSGDVYFGMRYPDTKNPSQTIRDAWQRLVSWMATRNPGAATNELLAEPETYDNYTFRGHDRSGTQVLRGTTITQYAGTYTHDTFERRMAKMLSECEDYMVMDSFMYHYTYLERHTMVDNVSKNNFWSSTDLLHWDLSKAYDMDTSDGNNNQGQMVFDYGNEWNDDIGGMKVYNGADSVWFVFCANLYEACQTMFTNREAAGAWSATAYHNFLLSEQQKVPERCWVQVYWYDYLRTYEQGISEEWMTFLDGGQKTHQRKHFEFFEELYDSSKYRGTVSVSQNVNFRAYTPNSWGGTITASGGTRMFRITSTSGSVVTTLPEGAEIQILEKTNNDWRMCTYGVHSGYIQKSAITAVEPKGELTITMYNKMYISADVGTTQLAPIKAARGVPVTIDFSSGGIMINNTLIAINTASMIQSISGMEQLFPDTCVFSAAFRLRELTIGSTTAGYQNTFLRTLALGNNTMLEYLYVQNLPGANSVLDLTNCPSLLYIDATGSGFTGYEFADGGLLNTAILNRPISLSMRNLAYLTDNHFTIADVTALTTLRFENVPNVDSLVLVNAASSLQIVRLIGIDWILLNASLLERISFLQGLDENNYTTNTSVLAGNAYVTSISQRKLEQYYAIWPSLVIEFESIIAQFAVHFYDYDGSPILDINGHEYIQYVDRGSLPYDPITSGEVVAPTRPSDQQYTYTFSGWENMDTIVLADRDVVAAYQEDLRTYTVRWFAQPGDLRKTQSNVPYGSEALYSDDQYEFPYLNDEEEGYIYKIFKGWDKSTGYVTGNMDVYAQWDRASLPVAGSVDLKDMSPAQIYGIAKRNAAADYWQDRDYIDINVGRDFNFSNITSEVILQNRYFNGNDQYKTNIKLFDENAPTFTLAIEFEFTDTINEETLVSCYDDFENDGFRLRYNNGADIQWGDKHQVVGNTNYRGVVVLRHKQGSNNLYLASSNPGNGINNNSIMVSELVRARATQTDAVLMFGNVESDDPSYTGYYGKGWIHWCKLWHGDLGNRVIQQLASWPHETWRMEYYGARRYRLAGETTRCSASFISSGSLPLINYMHSAAASTSTSSNAVGWDRAWLRNFVNVRCFNALPFEWQAMIKTIEVPTTAGNMSTEIVRSYDKIYIPALADLYLQTSEPYTFEGSLISWFTTNASRIKFRGLPVKSTAEWYTDASDPTLLPDLYTVREGDIWINSNNSRAYYYIPQDTYEKHRYYCGNLVTDQNNIIAAGVQGGLWIRSWSFWERSPYLGNNTSYYYVTDWGASGYTSGSATTSGIVPCFSI